MASHLKLFVTPRPRISELFARRCNLRAYMVSVYLCRLVKRWLFSSTWTAANTLLVVSVRVCQTGGLEFKSSRRRYLIRDFYPSCALTDCFTMRTLTAPCPWKDQANGRTGHTPSYAEAKTMKSLTLNSHVCNTVSLRDCSSSTSSVPHPSPYSCSYWQFVPLLSNFYWVK